MGGVAVDQNYSSPSHAFLLLQHVSFPWAAVLQDKLSPAWGLPWGCRAFSASAPGAAALPPSLTLVLTLLFIFCFFFFFPPPLSVQCFLTFLECIFAEAPLTWLTGSAVACGGSVVWMVLSSTGKTLTSFQRPPFSTSTIFSVYFLPI